MRKHWPVNKHPHKPGAINPDVTLVMMDGVIVVDKPAGWTSHDAVAKIRRLAGTRRVGHLGILDPMATGVLPLVIGKATRLAQFYLRMDKLYDAVIQFGWATDTYDVDGAPTSPQVAPAVSRAAIDQILLQFRGTFRQIPPPISAKKIGGTPAYKLARKQLPVELKPVEVTVHSLEVLDFTGTELRIQVHCTAGTYLRSIAHDLGVEAGCGAFLKSLRRLASGEFTIDMARSIEELSSLALENMIATALLASAQLLPEFPAERVDHLTAGHIRQGRDFRVSPFRVQRGARYVKAIGEDGELVAIGEVRLPSLYHPILVF